MLTVEDHRSERCVVEHVLRLSPLRLDRGRHEGVSYPVISPTPLWGTLRRLATSATICPQCSTRTCCPQTGSIPAMCPSNLRSTSTRIWAGCRTTRKSTTGRAALLDECTAHRGLRGQGYIAQSSGEAELGAAGSAASAGSSIQQVLCEAGAKSVKHFTIHTESNRGKSMVTRMGSFKTTRHISFRFLYGQY